MTPHFVRHEAENEGLHQRVRELEGLLHRSRAEADECVRGGVQAHDDRLCDEINAALADYDRRRRAALTVSLPQAV